MAKSKIYTKTGDKGETSLFTGTRVAKNDPFIQALGTVDECNSAIGLALSLLPPQANLEETYKQLEWIQHTLFDVGAALATPQTKAAAKKLEKTRFDPSGTDLLEKWIDQMEKDLPELKQFILPGGHPSAAALHLARSICREAERCVVPLNNLAEVSDHVLMYLNRLSDYLFVASRYINQVTFCNETVWQAHKKM